MAFAATHSYLDDLALACPNRVTLSLYDGAIAAMHTAIQSIVSDDIEVRCRSVQEATEIVTTLYLNLNIKHEGELADGLAKIYSHILGLLMRVNLFNDARIASRVIELLEPLRESWAEIDTLGTACEWPNRPVDPAGLERSELA